jgi:protein-tyrosine phosphatase
MVRVCFVCLGNICRSPTAECVFRDLVQKAGLRDEIKIDSAGTGGYHTGATPDKRSKAAAAKRGINVVGAARRFEALDFERFDYILAMDAENRQDLHQLAPDDLAVAKTTLLLDHDPKHPQGTPVPDPYYQGKFGFEVVLDLVTSACDQLLDKICKEHGLERK